MQQFCWLQVMTDSRWVLHVFPHPPTGQEVGSDSHEEERIYEGTVIGVQSTVRSLAAASVSAIGKKKKIAGLKCPLLILYACCSFNPSDRSWWWTPWATSTRVPTPLLRSRMRL